MPKKSATARSGAQRNRPKVQKTIELVRPERESQASEIEDTSEEITTGVSTATATVAASVDQKESVSVSSGSASARLAARRQAKQKVVQRNAATLITAEHFSYVRRDLLTIAILAILMFGVIIVLYFFLGVGA